jgi:hypothetical protein
MPQSAPQNATILGQQTGHLGMDKMGDSLDLSDEECELGRRNSCDFRPIPDPWRYRH